MTKSRGILKARKPWTQADDETLRRLFPTTVTRELAALLEIRSGDPYRQLAPWARSAAVSP